MVNGKRVIALAYRDIPHSLKDVMKKPREDVEKDLIFAGFLILDSPLKIGVSSVISEINRSAHITKMITGDAALTAIDVARKTEIIPAKHRVCILIYKQREGKKDELIWEEVMTGSETNRDKLVKNTYLFDPEQIQQHYQLVL